MQQLFAVQRVCKSLRETVNNSAKLQNKLRFLAVPNAMMDDAQLNATNPQTTNSPSSITIPHCENIPCEYLHPLDVLSKNPNSVTSLVGTKFNPMLRKFISTRCSRNDPPHEQYFTYDMANPIFDRGSTWRSMQVAQPPLAWVIVNPTACNEGSQLAERYGGDLWLETCYCGVVIENSGGVALGDVLDAAKMILTKHRKALKDYFEDGHIFFEDMDAEDIDIEELKFFLGLPNSETFRKN